DGGRVCLRRARPALSKSWRAVHLLTRCLAPGRRFSLRLGPALPHRNRLDGAGTMSPRPLAIASIVLLSIINYLGVKPGSRVLNVFVVLKVLALIVLIGFAWLSPGVPGWLSNARVDSTPTTVLTFGAALIPILFAYGGWQNANYVAEEMKDSRRYLPLSLI